MMIKILLAVIAVSVLLMGIMAGVYFVRQKQLISKEAVSPTGTAVMYLSPTSLSVNPGQSFDINVIFNAGGDTVSGATALLTYPVTSAVSILEILPNSTLVDQQWRYQQKTFTTEGNTVKISIIATDTSIEGYQFNGDTILATIRFQANSAGSISVAFDNSVTVLASKTTGLDILAAPPNPAGTYTVSGQAASPTPTPIPTTSPNTPTPTTSSSGNTTQPTLTPRPTAPTSTSPETLPVAGSPLPTLSLLLLGFLAIGSGAVMYKRFS